MSREPIHTEEAIIQQFLAPLAEGFAGALGLKDDCAVAAPSEGHEFVFKTDAIAAGVHFLEDDAAADIGWKALAVNVSDLAAKGARPVAYLLSLAFPEAPEREWLSGFVRGLGEAQSQFGIQLCGGDTDRRPGPISITPMVFGEVPTGRLVRRGSAKAGDIAYVSGSLGDAALGLALRRDEMLASRWALSAGQRASLIGRFVRPQPRLALAPVLLEHARAAMDISDGLLKDIGRMCAASGVAADIRYADLPLSEGFRAVQQTDPAAASDAVFAGDDYEILAAIPPERSESFAAAAADAGMCVSPIGLFMPPRDDRDRVMVRDASGRRLDFGRPGWDHF